VTTKFLLRLLLYVAFVLASQVSQASAYRILIWGDSLSSAYGIPVEAGWVSLLGRELENSNVDVINGSIPGEISYGGAERISQALEQHQPDLVILGLGSNDGLQGKDTGELHDNLARIIESSRGSGAEVLLLGMQIPPNYGRRYTEDFQNVFLALADSLDVALVPFFLEPVALDFDYMQADGMHPTAEAQPLLLQHIWPSVKAFLPAD
jgi:acyl-CoA thioesterase-1